MIHLGLYMKLNIFMKKCMANHMLLRKLHKFDTIFDFLDQLGKTDTLLSQRILGCLPHQLH